MPSNIAKIIDLQTYDNGWNADKTVQIGVNANAEGLTINLPAIMTEKNPQNFGANIHIERQAKGFLICLAPGDGEENKAFVYIMDDGSMKITDDSIGSVVMETPATPIETTPQIKARLEHLRGELRAERISMGELHELQSLAKHIEPGDVELLEAAGVPEFPESE